MLMLIVLLAPVLMLAAGIFVGQRNAGDDTGNANPEARTPELREIYVRLEKNPKHPRGPSGVATGSADAVKGEP